MATADFVPAGSKGGLFRNPWPALYTGLAAALVGFLLSKALPAGGVTFTLAGALAVGIAIVIRPQSPGVLGLAALAGLLASFGLEAWDAPFLAARVFTCLAAVAALLMLMPQLLRRLAFSVLILFHFGGIVTAVTSVSPNPWLSQQIWARVYRPYLEFMYLNNAYHFYSPEPGPGIMIWFYVKYDDGSGQWFKLPTRDQHPVALEYQRRLSFCESINQVEPPAPIPPEIGQRRQYAVNQLGILGHPLLDPSLQYHPPNWYSKQMLRTYARFIASHTPHPTNPERKVTGVKIYRVVHTILLPSMMASGREPTYKALYMPFYQGEYDPDGNLKNPDDPMLYWLVPILTLDEARLAQAQVLGSAPDKGRRETFEVDPEDPTIVNQLEKHARLETKILQ